MDNYRLVGHLTVGVDPAFLSTIILLRFFTLLLNPLDQHVAEETEAAPTNDDTDDHRRFSVAANVVASIAVAVTGAPAAGATTPALKHASFVN